MNSEKIFMGGYIMCSNTKCSKDCDGCIFINKEWFENNFAEITGFKDIEDEIEFKFEPPECPCFRSKEIFKKHIGGM